MWSITKQIKKTKYIDDIRNHSSVSSNHNQSRTSIIQKKNPSQLKNNGLIKMIKGLRAQILVLKARFKQFENIKNKMIYNCIEQIIQKYNAEMTEVKSKNEKLRLELQSQGEKRNEEYKRILKSLHEKQQQLSKLQSNHRLNQQKIKVAEQSQIIKNHYQKQIERHKTKIDDLIAVLQLQNIQNLNLQNKITKFKCMCTNQYQSNHNDSTTTRSNIVHQNTAHCNFSNVLLCSEINNAYSTSRLIDPYKSNDVLVKQKKDANILNKGLFENIQKTIQTPHRNKKQNGQNIKNVKKINLNNLIKNNGQQKLCMSFEKDKSTDTFRIMKSSNDNVMSRDNLLVKNKSKQTISTKFKSALKQYNMNKKTKITYYFK